VDKTNQESAAFKNLTEVRARIDAVDDALLHNLIDRTGLIEAVGLLKSQSGKQQTNAMRPGREAQMLRRLMVRAENKVPPELLLRIWRELIGWATQKQMSMIVHICAPDDSLALWDCARSHFSGFARFKTHGTIKDVVAALDKSPYDIAVLPAGEKATRTWLEPLMSAVSCDARIAGCLPLIGKNPMAYVFGTMAVEETGDDRSLFYVVADPGQSMADVKLAFVQAEIEVGSLISMEIKPHDSSKTWLVTCRGYYDQAAPELETLNRRAGIIAVRYIGGYPAPIEVGEQ
jgi:chorismate mutase / prephenate dehydratase